MKFRISLLSSQKKIILLVFYWDCGKDFKINLVRTDTFMMLNLSFKEHSRHICKVFDSLRNVLKFYSNRSYTFLVEFIPKNFFLFFLGAIINNFVSP